MSFSIEDRDASGRKKSAFYSVTASRGTGAELTQAHEDGTPAGWARDEVQVIRTMLSKHVVRATYDDAVRRGIVNRNVAVEECKAILGSYDDAIAREIRALCPDKDAK